MELRKPRPSATTIIFVACGVWMIGLGLYFMFLRPPILPEDLRYLRSSATEIQSAVPRLERWLGHVFMVMGGFMAGSGVLTIFVAVNAWPVRDKWTWMVLAFVGLLTVGTMSLMNFQLNSDFKWLLLIPALLWCVGLVFRTVIRSSGSPSTRVM